MGYPTVTLDNSAGSNTAASGAGPVAPVTGAAAAHTGGAASTTITLTNSPDLSTIAVDGTAALYLATASGRKFTKILAKDNSAKTLTVEDSFTIASGSAVDYAVGGKRLDFETTNANTKQLFTDGKTGWGVDILETGTNYALTSTIPLSPDTSTVLGLFKIMSSSVNRPVISSSASIFTGYGYNVVMRHLGFTGGVYLYAQGGPGGILAVVDSILDNAIANYPGGTWSPSVCVFDCEIKNIVADVPAVQFNSLTSYVVGCFIHNCTGFGVFHEAVGGGVHVITNNVVTNNGRDGINLGGAYANSIFQIRNNTVANNAGHGVYLQAASSGSPNALHDLSNNAVYGNGGYGIKSDETVELILSNRNNAYGSNTSGARSGVSVGVNDVSLTADPFTNAAGGDYSLNATAGGGALLRAAGFPAYLDIGGLQHQDSGGGSPPPPPFPRGRAF